MSYKLTGVSSLFQIIIVLILKKYLKIKNYKKGQHGAGRGQHGATKRGHGAAPC